VERRAPAVQIARALHCGDAHRQMCRRRRRGHSRTMCRAYDAPANQGPERTRVTQARVQYDADGRYR
jgi:hypothetical protein